VLDTLEIHSSTQEGRSIPLGPQSVADFCSAVIAAMQDSGMPVSINAMPTEIADAIRFDQDTAERAYDPDQALALWTARGPGLVAKPPAWPALHTERSPTGYEAFHRRPG
jgi:hypothetical protein